jgi:DNA-binding beta-propeller fold protein YncE
MTMTRRATAKGPYNKKVCSEDGQFMTPTGVATDGSGNVYVADTNNNRIQKFACP